MTDPHRQPRIDAIKHVYALLDADVLSNEYTQSIAFLIALCQTMCNITDEELERER